MENVNNNPTVPFTIDKFDPHPASIIKWHGRTVCEEYMTWKKTNKVKVTFEMWFKSHYTNPEVTTHPNK